MARGVKIGAPVRGSQSGRPVMVLIDLLGRRWAFRILFELDAHGPLTFGELLSQCGTISPSVLSQRLRELTENKIIQQGSSGYELTPVAQSLRDPLAGLYAWSGRWARSLAATSARKSGAKKSRAKKSSSSKKAKKAASKKH